VWGSAASTATNLELSSLPAFGGQRPNIAWLLGKLQQLTSNKATVMRLNDKLKQQKSDTADSPSAKALVDLLLQPVTAAAATLATSATAGSSTADNSGGSSSTRSSTSTRNAAVAVAQLSSGVCSAVVALASSSNAASLQQVMLAVLEVTESIARMQLPASFPAALQAALTSSTVTSGDAGVDGGVVSFVKKVLGKADQRQLSADAQASILSSALQALASGQQGSRDWVQEQQEPFSWLWSELVAVAPEWKQQPLTSAAAAALLATPGVIRQLLQPGLPVLLVQALLQGAVPAQASAAAQEVVDYALDQGLLQQMPGELVGQVAALSGAKVGWQSQLQMVGLLLEQGQALSREGAAALLEGCGAAAASAEAAKLEREGEVGDGVGKEGRWQQLLALLRIKCTTAPAAAAYGSICMLIEAGEGRLDREQLWQLYELLLVCQAAKGWGEEHLGLSAAACNVLIVQQAKPEQQQQGHGDEGFKLACERVLQVWQQFAQAFPGEQAARELEQEAQLRLLRALVSSREGTAALGLVQQLPVLLPTLVEHWQQQSDTVGTGLLMQALQVAVQQGTSDAAGAAIGILRIAAARGLEGQLWEERGTMAGVLGLLCLQGKQEVAERWVKEHLAAEDSAAEGGAGRAAAALFSEMMSMSQVAAAVMQQQQQVVGLLAAFLPSGGHGSLLSVLEPSQKEDLVLLCCTTVQNTTISTNSSNQQAAHAFRLPSPIQLAEEAVASFFKLPTKVAVALVNALAQSEPLLKPSVAAVLLGEVTGQQLVAAAGAGSTSSSTATTARAAAAPVGLHGNISEASDTTGAAAGQSEAAAVSRCRLASKVLADFCYVQLGCTADTGAEADTAESAMDWAYALSKDAAAAALFASWYWAQPSRSVEAAAEAEAAGGEGPPPPLHVAPPVLPSPAACGLLGEALYSAARQGVSEKPGLDSCLLDLALMAAAAAEDMDRGTLLLRRVKYRPYCWWAHDEADPAADRGGGVLGSRFGAANRQPC
jgi:hypothetical protein